MKNKLLDIFDIDEIKKQITNCPKNKLVIITSDWAYDRPEYSKEEQKEDKDFKDMQEIEALVGCPVYVDDANQLVADPHGIYEW